MVGRGEVDAELEKETAEECEKYGRVLKCAVYEVQLPTVADEDAVRIFVQFDSISSARSGMVVLAV